MVVTGTEHRTDAVETDDAYADTQYGVAQSGAGHDEGGGEVVDGGDEAKTVAELPISIGCRVHHRTGERVRSVRGWRAGLTAAAVLTLCGAVTASGFMWRAHNDLAAGTRRTAEFAAVARQGVTTLMSIKSASAQDDIQRILDVSTGTFLEQFSDNVGAFSMIVGGSNVETTAAVNASAVQAEQVDSAIVMVAATSEITNSTGSPVNSRSWRLLVTVARDDGRLKMSNVEFVP